MKKIFLISTLLIPTLVYSQTVKTLSCVDSVGPKFQMVVKFNDQSKKIVDPSPNDFDFLVTNDIISYKTRGDDGDIFSTVIYRSTGKYTVFSKFKGQDFVFSGTCSMVTQNKF